MTDEYGYEYEPVCVVCGGDWDDMVDGHMIIATKRFHACINCIVNMEWESWEDMDFARLS